MKKKVKKAKSVAKVRMYMPNVVIERVLFDGKTKRVSAVDVYDKATGMAYFCEVVDIHRKGI